METPKLQNAQRELKMRPHVDSMPSLETKVSGANPGNSFTEPFVSRWLLKGFASKRSIRIPGRVVPLGSDRALPRERLPEPLVFRWLLKGFASKRSNRLPARVVP